MYTRYDIDAVKSQHFLVMQLVTYHGLFDEAMFVSFVFLVTTCLQVWVPLDQNHHCNHAMDSYL